jgi:hypothetical protein
MYDDPACEYMIYGLKPGFTHICCEGTASRDETLAHLSPLKWEHINLTGDYHWRKDAGLQDGKLRPVRGHQAVAFP